MNNGNQLYHELTQFTGCDQPFSHGLHKHLHYTDGFRHFIREAGNGAQWLVDILATEPKIMDQVKNDRFANVELKVLEDKSWTLTVDDGNGRVVYQCAESYTDCPVAPVTEIMNPKGIWHFYIEMVPIGEKVWPMAMLPRER